MNHKKNKFLLAALWLVMSVQNSMAGLYPGDIVGYMPAVLGAALMYSCAPFVQKNEEIVVQELVEELQNNIEKRRVVVYTTIEKLQQKLNLLQAESQEYGTTSSVDEKKIIRQLNQAHEEYRAIDLDYQIEYIRIRPRARSIKEGCAGGIVVGSCWVLFSVFYHTIFRDAFKAEWHRI